MNNKRQTITPATQQILSGSAQQILSEAQSWQAALASVITEPRELLQLLELDLALLPAAEQVAKQFPLRVPRGFVARMKKGDVTDPLLRQVLPIGAELQTQSGFVLDPLAEKAVNPLPGLLHKYHGRVLLTVVGACAINCRYCFRRHFPYSENNPGKQGWEAVLNYIAADSTISEVIFSGGDPLLARDEYLAELSARIATIAHVKTLRIHTRVPIVIPERITSAFLQWFSNSRLRPVLVVHCNHAQEINAEVVTAMQELKRHGVTLLNQAVLLEGINDSVSTLINLSTACFNAGILPYYLHVLDRVQGAAHFEVAETTALQLLSEVRRQLPGYLVPTLVREQADMPAKIPL